MIKLIFKNNYKESITFISNAYLNTKILSHLLIHFLNNNFRKELFIYAFYMFYLLVVIIFIKLALPDLK